MTPLEVIAMAAAAKKLIDELAPSVIEALIPALEGLKTDDRNLTRKSFALAMARTHKHAVEQAVLRRPKVDKK